MLHFLTNVINSNPAIISTNLSTSFSNKLQFYLPSHHLLQQNGQKMTEKFCPGMYFSPQGPPTSLFQDLHTGPGPKVFSARSTKGAFGIQEPCQRHGPGQNSPKRGQNWSKIWPNGPERGLSRSKMEANLPQKWPNGPRRGPKAPGNFQHPHQRRPAPATPGSWKPGPKSLGTFLAAAKLLGI